MRVAPWPSAAVAVALVMDELLAVAVMVVVIVCGFGGSAAPAVTGTLTLAEPAGIVTVAGTVAAAAFEELNAIVRAVGVVADRLRVVF